MLLGYARVSTKDQSLEPQLAALRKARVQKRYTFTDVASGAKDIRPGLDKLMEHAREGDTVVVWKLDRIGRSVRHLVKLMNDLDARGVAFRSLTDPIDTSTAAGRLWFHMCASFAEFERDLIRERTKAGLTAARARGRKGGRHPKLNKKQAEMARRLLKDGQTYEEVAQAFKVSRMTLYRTLERHAQ